MKEMMSMLIYPLPKFIKKIVYKPQTIKKSDIDMLPYKMNDPDIVHMIILIIG